jgi:hypothetical protein
MSALLTTTMTYMKNVIDGFEAAGRGHIKMAVGGAPISQMFADEIGADGYGADASSAVDLFLRLVGRGGDAVSAPAVAAPAQAAAPAARLADNVVKYQILYWRDLPSSIKAWDDFGEIKTDLAGRFSDRIDAEAMKLGLTSGDDYVAQLRWGDESERPGNPEDVVKALRRELEAKSP